MTKIISGSLKGRTIKGYDIIGTRPTMDRIKESLFAMIQNYLDNSIVLDLFAGSGNLGIEAISNGAKLVYFNDYNKKCIKVINDNLLSFNVLDKGIILNNDYHKTLKYLKEQNIIFDLIFLDPPYKDRIVEDIMDIVINNHLLNNNGLIICEVNYPMNYQNMALCLYKQRDFKDKKIFIYKKQ